MNRILLIAMMLMIPLNAAGQAHAQGGMVLAFYYGWYNQASWQDAQLLDRPAEPYTSGDAAAIARQIEQAQAAGIDGFAMSWFGPAEPHTTGVFTHLLEQAAGRGFKAAAVIDFSASWMDSTGEVVRAIEVVLNDFAARPAYARLGGKPLLFFWNQSRFTPQQWRDIRAQTDPDHGAIWFAEGDALTFVGPFDGLYNYNIAWSANPAGTNATWAARAADAGAYFAATAMPGFDETHLGRGAGAVFRARQAGDYFRSSFEGAAAVNPHLILITSWNEYFENSHIEPSQNHGSTYLDLARSLIAAYKAGHSPPPPPEEATTPPEGQSEAATGLTALPTVSMLNVRLLPTTDSTVLAGVSAGGEYPLLGRNARSDWWFIDFGGGTGWIYATYARVQGGDAGSLPVLDESGAVGAGGDTAPADGQAETLTQPGDTIAIPLSDTDMHAHPRYDSDSIATAYAEARYPIIGKSDDGRWWLVGFQNGRGWLPASSARYEFFNGQDLGTVPVTDEAGAVDVNVEGAGEAVTGGPVDALPVVGSDSGAEEGIFALPEQDEILRTIPHPNAEEVAILEAGGRYPIVGRTADSKWWLIDYGEGTAWLYSKGVRYEFINHGGMAEVPVAE